jgi:uncharacterized protein YdhG (YjbR/CyaY superfamily)
MYAFGTFGRSPAEEAPLPEAGRNRSSWTFGGESDRQTVRDNIVTDRSIARNMDEYIQAFSPEVQSILAKIRSTIRKAVPDAEEKISYRMPAFTLRGSNLIYFAAFKRHIGLYPPVKGDETLSKEISAYEGEKGNLRFPLDEPIPYDLISRIVKFRVKEHLERASSKKGTKKR